MEYYSDSRSFFEFSDGVADPDTVEFQSVKGRLHCFSILLKKAALLPFALLYKFYKTVFRVAGLLISAVVLVSTFGTSGGSREFFVRRVSSLATDLADWVLFPFAVLVCFVKLLLGGLIHPALRF